MTLETIVRFARILGFSATVARALRQAKFEKVRVDDKPLTRVGLTGVELTAEDERTIRQAVCKVLRGRRSLFRDERAPEREVDAVLDGLSTEVRRRVLANFICARLEGRDYLAVLEEKMKEHGLCLSMHYAENVIDRLREAYIAYQWMLEKLAIEDDVKKALSDVVAPFFEGYVVFNPIDPLNLLKHRDRYNKEMHVAHHMKWTIEEEYRKKLEGVVKKIHKEHDDYRDYCNQAISGSLQDRQVAAEGVEEFIRTQKAKAQSQKMPKKATK